MPKLVILKTMAVAILCGAVLSMAACGGDSNDDTNVATSTADVQETPEATSEGGEATATEESAEPPSGLLDACSLITEAEAAAAIGGTTDPPEPGLAGELSQCVWRIQGGSDLDDAVIIQAGSGVSDDHFEQLVEENAPEELGALEPVSGLGDKAYQQIATFVHSGDAMVVVTVLDNESTSLEADAQTQQDIARKAIGRLP